MTETAENAQPGDYVCGDCDRIERDPIFLDLETCSKCGELIEAIPEQYDREQIHTVRSNANGTQR